MGLLPRAKPAFIFQGSDGGCQASYSLSLEKFFPLLLSTSPLQVVILSSGFIDEVIC